jgi:hypothetical protein
MGTEEAAAYWSASAALEMAIAAGKLRPGTPGWRRTAAHITARFLGSVHDDTTGTTWLQWVHTERLQRFAESRGPARARLPNPSPTSSSNRCPYRPTPRRSLRRCGGCSTTPPPVRR